MRVDRSAARCVKSLFVPGRVAALAWVPILFALAGCNRPPAAETTEPAPGGAAPAMSEQSLVQRGEMLVTLGGCHDCHSPKVMTPSGPEPDMSRALAGHPQEAGVPQPFKGGDSTWTTHTNDHLTAWSGAWGVTFAANLTPDDNTGLGIWTEDMFLSAIKEGKHMGTSRPILPPMPWQMYAKLPDEELRAIFAYLKSLPPIQNRVPVPLTPEGRPIEEPQ